MTLLRPRRVDPEGPPADVPVRTLVVWVPDWPLVAARADPAVPAAAFRANRVVAANAAARALGVARHQRRREAQGRCPGLVVLDHDPERDARAFEVVVGALEALTPRLEVARPGRCAFPTRGPSRYFGGDEALARRAVAAVDEVLHGAEVAVGVADGPFAATQAARTARRRAVHPVPDDPAPAPVWVVAPGASGAYLAPLSLASLDRPELADVLVRLGMATLGDLAALPVGDVHGRFGPVGLEAHRLARGLDVRPPATEPPPPDLVCETELDPPADQVAPLAFAARALAEDLHGRLAARGSVCSRIVVTAETEHGERSERVWRHATAETGGGLTAGAIADRVRWQMDGWLHANPRRRPTAGIVRLRIRPDEVLAADGHQLGFWGADAGAADRAVRAVARVQGLLGAEAVLVPEPAGGRDPAEQVRLVPAAAVDLAAARHVDEPAAPPWPGRLPTPAPATLHPEPVPVDLVDARGATVVVDGRCHVTAEPAVLVVPEPGTTRRLRLPVASWAGPWPVDERWWDPDRHDRRARFQVVTADGVARLVVLAGGAWAAVATYD